jgi:hypothetical protein
VLGGNVLWLEPGAIDLVMVGLAVLLVGLAMVFYGTLAMRELRDPDRRDLGSTPAIRAMLVTGCVLLFVFIIFYTFVSDTSLAAAIYPQCPTTINAAKGCPGPITGLFISRTIFNVILGIAIVCALGAFALRLHYLMRPVRKRSMSGFYLIGVNLAQFGVLFLLAWFLVYPVIAWIHSWSFIGLGDYLTVCGKKSLVPQSCGFSQQAGYIIDTVITGGTFTLLMAAIAVWRTKRNLVVIGSVTITAVLGLATLITHTNPDEIIIAALLCGGILALATIWTSVARREFAVVGENNLGCIGYWLIVGTCLLIYIAAFAFFSLPVFPNETEPNIPFTPGGGFMLQPPGTVNATATFIFIGILAAIQFYFLTRNRYKI